MTAAHAVTEHEAHAIKRDAIIRRAAVKLARIDDLRAALHLSESGKTQREIADLLHVTQPVVHRLLRDAQFLGTEVTPEEIIFRAAVDKTPRDALVRQLSSITYTFPVYAPYPAEGATPGTWDQVEYAYYSDLLTKEEYGRIEAAVKPPPAE